ncbi:D-alanyl-D-alanine carboxypeptidase/D-alanyl-D-alanine endopeptidase [Corynebacterium guangdongense]|uniref:D-alanyl-D-alanine carboxypeptidase/D-alanyl-D-alanine-endopeptidase (Penicillin-binding protein 4) n=1 Tax=Corynebacterium guangdongense TaxID=1783348 RepID=A0ABU2A127_9CORY|nr:D-alanyl-D-alanine carboxypeptidase/D-alanyl-D-alanine-endopeptidase [Corynebacterium guangdongense]MDR7330313.1 D-alanyl-D-alanine carboxypeptidase/D-alanyl-D-alanine-endopeptidase (penicillin-binding protein 4) [Corynebacterium guangdongense]WJZ18871.1 D-alanyl-D-alanine carboxypeptidase DacC precursor [Corynebacterium guangdongense]
MSTKNIVSGIAVVLLGATVAGTAVLGVEVHERYSGLRHAPAYQLQEPQQLVLPADDPANLVEVDAAATAAALQAAAENPAMATLHGRVTDATTGQTVWESNADVPLTPASSTKILTAAAAVLTLDPGRTIATEVVAGPYPGSVVIRAAGDVWLDDSALDELAAELGEGVDQVIVDTSAWSGPALAEGVEADNVDGGYIAPMQPAMINAARLGGDEGDLPRSHTPALDVARALADRLGAATVGEGPAPAGAKVLAAVESPPLSARAEEMVKWSDNVMAEAIAREVATARGAEASFPGAAQATLDTLSEAGFDVSGVTLADNSGMSTLNLIPPALLDEIVLRAATEPQLRPLLGALPVASGVGTLESRYDGLDGRGWVRAKTGTLTGVNALVGTVTGESGHVYTFALLSNGGADTLATRRALDEFASVLRNA